MAFCGKCGSSVNEGLSFCPNCGAAVVSTAAGTTHSYGSLHSPTAAANGLQENLAGLLCYALGWLTGILFLLIDKRPFVRFHAAQSIVVFGSLFILRLVLIFAFMGGGYYGFWAFHALISMLLSLITLAAWIVLMVMAYQGKEFEVPGAAGVARNIAGKVN